MSKTRALLLASVGLVGLAAMPALASEAYGDPFTGEGFIKDDWQLVCDNTLTCRAAGYGEDDGSEPASMLLVLEPNKASVTAYVDFINLEDEVSQSAVGKGDPTLWLNNQNYGPIKNEGGDGKLRLNAAQTKQVIGHAQMNNKIEIKSVQKVWQISDKGLSAVLLKADEIQGRVGTSLALVSKNNPNKQTPKSAMAQPVIQKAPVYSEEQQQLDAKTLSYFQKNIGRWINVEARPYSGNNDEMGDCELINPKSDYYAIFTEYLEDAPQWDFIAVDSKYTLASHICWRGAYNEGYGYWLIDNDKPTNPQLITVSGSFYNQGELTAAHKSRGLGDCWGHKTWVWDGRHFVLAEQSSTGMCRGFAGGAWNLPTYVSEVIADNTQIKPLHR